MTFGEPWVPIDELSASTPFSLAPVRWIREHEETDEDGESVVRSEPMIDVVGEQHRLAGIAAAKQAITEAGAFLPPIFWLVPDDANEYDANAVAVYAVVHRAAIHVGFLPRNAAVHFRESMAAIGHPRGSLEVRGCITQGSSKPHPNVRLNLPWSFADLVLNGFADDPANRPRWLSDPAPVARRPHGGRRAAAFSDDELCKMYCWFGHQNGWFLLPDAVESQAQGFRASGLGSLHKVLPVFEEDIEEDAVAGREWATFNHNSEAKAFAKGVIRDHLSESMIDEDVKEEFKGTSVRGQLKDMSKQLYEIEWVRLGPPPEMLGTMTLQKIGDGSDDYEVRAIEFVNA